MTIAPSEHGAAPQPQPQAGLIDPAPISDRAGSDDHGPDVGAPIVSVRGLRRTFGARTVLAGVDLQIARGEFVALLGRSGSGKSTFLRAIARLDRGVAGAGELAVADHRAVVFQDARLLPWARVIDNVILGLHAKNARERGLVTLQEVGLGSRASSWPVELSGGEQQRVALARALVHEPELILADEPFGALDALTRIRMHALLRELCVRHRPAVLLVTHDVDEAIALADRVIVLEEGRIILDRAISLRAPRVHRDPAFSTYRESLLRALGVFLDEQT
jgi:sulfonate transport system ATP-binding protein